MNEKLAGALVGFGGVAEHAHLPAYQHHPSAELRAVAEPDADARARAREATGGSIRVYANIGELLACERLDFVDIAAPPSEHLDAIEHAARGGVHVLVEKPLALTRREAERAQRAAERAGTALMTVHNWHHAPSFRAARAALGSGSVGVPKEIEFSTERTEPAGGTGSWRLDMKIAGGGILMDHGWHQIYLARALLGGCDPRSVRAVTECRRWTDGSVEDTADCRIHFMGDAFAHLRLSWAAPARRTSVTIRGDSGSLRIDGSNVTVVTAAGPERPWPVEHNEPDDSYHASWFPRVLDAFIEAVEDPTRAAANRREAMVCQAVLAAAYCSSDRAGAEVVVEL